MSYTLTKRGGGGKKQRTLKNKNKRIFKQNGVGAISIDINDNYLEDPTGISWIQPNAITKNNYTINGNYDNNGNISIVDYGPDNIDQLIKNLKV